MNKLCLCVLFACVATGCASYTVPSGAIGSYGATGHGYNYGVDILPAYGGAPQGAYVPPTTALYGSSHPQAKSNAYAVNAAAPAGVYRQVVVPSYTILEIPEVISQHGSYVSSPAVSSGHKSSVGSYKAPASSGIYQLPAATTSYQAPAASSVYQVPAAYGAGPSVHYGSVAGPY